MLKVSTDIHNRTKHYFLASTRLNPCIQQQHSHQHVDMFFFTWVAKYFEIGMEINLCKPTTPIRWMSNLTPNVIVIQACKVHSQQVTVNNVFELNNYVTVFGLPCEKRKAPSSSPLRAHTGRQSSSDTVCKWQNANVWEPTLQQDCHLWVFCLWERPEKTDNVTGN